MTSLNGGSAETGPGCFLWRAADLSNDGRDAGAETENGEERNSDSLSAPRSKGGVRETRANRESAKAGLDGLMKHTDRKFNALLDILRFVD